MSVTLPKHFEDWAKAEVASGRARSVEDLAREALEAHRRHVEAFRASLADAVAEADRDGWIEGDSVLSEMDALIADLERDAQAAK